MTFRTPFPGAWRPVVCAVAAGVVVASCSAAVPVAGQRVSSAQPHKSQFQAIYPHDFPIHGIDVSKYQGDIDWRAVRASGVQFAYIKATEGGDRVDSKFRQNWEGSKAAGVQRGAYHFAYWCRTPQEEMANFVNTVPPEADALPPVLDVEATPTSRTCRKVLQRGETIARMREMLQTMERVYHKRPVIYSTVDFYQAILHPSELEDYPIWIRSTKYSPPVKYGSRNWHLWQYQSDARVPGIQGYVDRNAFHGDQKQWLAFAGGRLEGPVTAYAQVETTTPVVTASIPGAVAAPRSDALVPPGAIAGLRRPSPDDAGDDE